MTWQVGFGSEIGGFGSETQIFAVDPDQDPNTDFVPNPDPRQKYSGLQCCSGSHSSS